MPPTPWPGHRAGLVMFQVRHVDAEGVGGPSLLRCSLGNHLINGGENSSVASAAAQVARQCFSDGLAVGVRLLVEQVSNRHHQSRSTESTLHCTTVDKCLLDITERTVGACNRFDRGDRCIGDRCRHDKARAHQHAIDEYRT